MKQTNFVTIPHNICISNGTMITRQHREGASSSIVKVPGDVPPTRVCFFGLVV